MPRPAPPSPSDDDIRIQLLYLRQHLNYASQSLTFSSKDMPKPLYIRVRELNQRVVKSDQIDLCVRLDNLLNLTNDKSIDYYTQELDCYDPFGNQESIIISLLLLDILHYEHWNQYYYKNMSDEDLLNLINKGIKKYKVEKKKKDLENDFQGV
ncbi:MAG: hypothetical protein J6T74_08290 [Clostridia bacterium]|nr:hypothetical protein [Clostridia bacterium]